MRTYNILDFRPHLHHIKAGFTLLEVMVAMAIMAIALTSVLGLQSQTVSLASEAKFITSGPLLAQMKMAEIEMKKSEDLTSDSGDFGEDFPGYFWDMTVRDFVFPGTENYSYGLKQIDLNISWASNPRYQYKLRLFTQ